MGELGFTPRGAASFVDYMTDELLYFEGDDPAIPYHFVRRRGKLVVIVGENAAGKSFARRLIQLLCRDVNIECIHLSMQGRLGGMGAVSAFVYGSEDWQATGDNTANTILGAIRTAEARTSDHTIFWDEPDLGLSDNAAAGAGVTIREFVQNSGRHTRAVFVATHSRYLVRELIPINPHYLHLGTGEGAPATLEDWTNRPVEPMDLEQLRKAGNDRFRRIQKILNGVKRRR